MKFNLTPEQETAIFALIGLIVQGVLGEVADGKPLTWTGLALVLLTSAGNYVTSKRRTNGS